MALTTEPKKYKCTGLDGFRLAYQGWLNQGESWGEHDSHVQHMQQFESFDIENLHFAVSGIGILYIACAWI